MGRSFHLAMERYLTRYRVVNAGIAVLGSLFLAGCSATCGAPTGTRVM